MIPPAGQPAEDIAVGDRFELEGITWTVHRIAHYRVAACHYVDERGVKHYRTFALSQLRTARRVGP